jgi:NO-binding membrane sensor protein with MHYT domain
MVITAARGGSPVTVHALFTALNNADTAKITLFAAMIAAVALAARRRHGLPPWFTTASVIFAPVLAASGLAFPLHSRQLYTLLYFTLPLLLAWVAAFTAVTARRPARIPENTVTP